MLGVVLSLYIKKSDSRLFSIILIARLQTTNTKEGVMYKNILIPLDGSKLAECVLSHVDGFISDGGVETITFVRVVKPAGFLSIAQNVDAESEPKEYENMMISLDRIEEKRVSLAAKYLEEILNRLKQNGIEYKKEVLVGKISKNIIKYAESHDVDLILMATHGRSGVKGWLHGRTADLLLRLSRIPILSVRPEEMDS